MDMISSADFLRGVSVLLDPQVHLFVFLGALVGLIFGAAPGLTAPAAVALMIPLTYGMGLQHSLALLMGVYCAGYFAGSIPAILINTPGTPANAATGMDGYPMAKRGEGDRAITLAIFGSFIGGVVSMILLATIAPGLARFALTFTSVEYFSLALLGLVCVAGISEGSLIKGIGAALLGVFISTVGLDPVSGVPRMTFGMPYLLGGIEIIPAMIGLFALSEMLVKSQRPRGPEEVVMPTLQRASLRGVLRDYGSNKWLSLKSSLMGAFIGLLPGTGPAIASWVAYGDALRARKPGDTFGKGDPKGVIATETSNNAVTGGAMVPLLTLGIPGDPVTAILIGALMIHGIEPGPFFIRDYAWLFIAIVALLFLSNIWMVIIGLASRRTMSKVVQVPPHILVPTICVMAAAGSYAVHSSGFDVRLVLIFGLAGYLMVRYQFSIAAMVLGLVLGPILETNLRNALLGARMDWTVFFTRPISLSILVIMVLMLVIWNIQERRQARIAQQALTAQERGN
jgi:putative tricarboxylic transport membrane protein